MFCLELIATGKGLKILPGDFCSKGNGFVLSTQSECSLPPFEDPLSLLGLSIRFSYFSSKLLLKSLSMMLAKLGLSGLSLEDLRRLFRSYRNKEVGLGVKGHSKGQVLKGLGDVSYLKDEMVGGSELGGLRVRLSLIEIDGSGGFEEENEEVYFKKSELIVVGILSSLSILTGIGSVPLEDE